MAGAVTKSELDSSIWQNFYDVLVNDVVGKSITDAHGNTHTLSRATNSFPDTQIDNKSTYPILVIESPDLSSESFTLDKEQINGTITIEIYSTSSEVASKFFNKILDSIETSKPEFSDNNIHNIKIDSTDSVHVQRNQIKVHVRSVTYSFVTRYTKTGGH